MLIQDKIDNLKSSEAYEQWLHECDSESYLAHIFIMLEKVDQTTILENLPVQIGFYNPSNDTITVFSIDQENNVKKLPDSEVFKEEDKTVVRLDPDSVKIDLKDPFDKAVEFAEKNYQKHQPDRIICILQNIEEQQVYNVTVVTKSFHMINVRIDTSTGEIVKHSISSVFDLKKDDKPGIV